jgi:hypothetical protein
MMERVMVPPGVGYALAPVRGSGGAVGFAPSMRMEDGSWMARAGYRIVIERLRALTPRELWGRG